MRLPVLTAGAKPSRFLPVQKRVVALRAYGSAPEDSPPSLPAASVAPPPEIGSGIREWLASPFDFAAFGPRLTVGALLSAPDRIQNLSYEIQRARETIESPAPPEDKGKLLAAQIETLTTEALEKGADAESSILEQVKVYLPEDIATLITIPETPVSKPDGLSTRSGPVVTELPDDVELN